MTEKKSAIQATAERDSNGDIIVRTPEQARALAKRMFGELPKNEMRFLCATCGWDKTLAFDEEEIAALGNDISSYGGPCPQCKYMTLAPYGDILAGTNIQKMAEESYFQQIDQAADIVLDKVQDRVADLMTGTPRAAKAAPAKPGPVAVSREDLPDASTVSDEDLTPR